MKQKNPQNNDKFKISGTTWDEDFLMDGTLYQIFRAILNTSSTIMRHWSKCKSTDIRKVTLKNKRGYYLEFLVAYAMKLPGCAEKSIKGD